MSTTKVVTHRSIASLKLPRSAPALIVYAQGIITGMTGNPSFPTPTPPLAEVNAARADLHTAETAALARTTGAVAVRNEKRAVLIALLELLRAYVQSIADKNPENAPSIIQSAGIAVRKVATRAPRVFAAKLGAVSGMAKVIAPSAGHRSSYEWQSSTDGGKTWIELPPTLQAKTTVAGLTPGSTVEFRFRAVTKPGAGDWSQPVSLLVR